MLLIGMPSAMGFGIRRSESIAGINNRLIATAKAMEIDKRIPSCLTESIA